MYQIFTTTWLCKWSGFDSAVAHRQAKLPWNPITKIRTYRYYAWNILLRNGYSVTNYYDSIEISFYSIYFHHGTRWILWSSGLSQHGAADRDSETQILRRRVWNPGIEISRGWGSYFYWTKYDSTCKGSEQMTWIKHFSCVRLAPSNCTVPLAVPGFCTCSSMWFSVLHE